MSDIVKLAPRASYPKVVEMLEQELERARAGRYVTVGIVAVTPEGVARSRSAASGTAHGHHLVAGCGYLQKQVTDRLEDEDEPGSD